MKTIWKVVFIAAAVLVIAAVGWFGYSVYNKKSSSAMRQAVFLTNGQVYFGYVKDPDDQVVTIKDVFYLKTQDLLQPNNDQNAATSNKKISLVKLGNELHGPTDEMMINRDQILFIENMRDNSKINQAIEKYSDQTTASAK